MGSEPVVRIAEVAPPPPERPFAGVLAQANLESSCTALLESGERAAGLGRWSFFALSLGTPRRFAPHRGPDGLEALERALAALRGEHSAERWRAVREAAGLPFTGGVITAIGYEYGARFERVRNLRPRKHAAPNRSGGLWFVPLRHVLAYDHVRARAWIAGSPRGFEQAHARWLRWLAAARSARCHAGDRLFCGTPPRVRPNLDRAAYERAVARTIEWIRAGDIFEANLSQQVHVRAHFDPLAVYRRLAARTTGPFSAWLRSGAWTIVSISPERFLRREADRLETRPIKGTRPRARRAADDARLAAALRASEKDRAELAMIVDLERNDLGRVARAGSVVVRAAAEPIAFRAVHHLVGHVEARAREGLRLSALLRACFPGGSITGAPKPRAMEVIEALEPLPRGIYTGAIGWVGADGDLDLNVAIRTIEFDENGARFGIGGAVTAESDPAAEYEETLVKGAPLADALGFRIEQLGAAPPGDERAP